MKNIELDFFPNGYRHCVTLSYDDGRIEDYRLVEMLNKYNLKGTFHLCCPEWRDRFEFLKWDNARYVEIDDYAKLYEGHEISCHLAHHPFIYKLPREGYATEIYRNKIFLEDLCGYPVRGMSYPFGGSTPEATATFSAVGMEYARSVKEDHTFGLPSDFMDWPATCHHSKGMEHVENFFKKEMFPRMKLFYIWGHSYEFYKEEQWEEMEELCKVISNREDTWYASSIEIVDYVNAMKNLRFTSEMTAVYNPSAISVWIGVDGEPLEIPSGKTVAL